MVDDGARHGQKSAMQNILLVAVGGAIGSVLRHLVSLTSLRLFGPNFPWGTFAVNVVGCFAMGVFIETLARRWGGWNELRLFIATGMLGGFTTFSAFSLDFGVLWERGVIGQAFAYAAGSVLVSLLALFAGLWFVRSFG